MNLGVPTKHRVRLGAPRTASRRSLERRKRRICCAGVLPFALLLSVFFASGAMGAAALVGLGSAASLRSGARRLVRLLLRPG